MPLRPPVAILNPHSPQANGLRAWLPLAGARDRRERISGVVLAATGTVTTGTGGGVAYATAGAGAAAMVDQSGLGPVLTSGVGGGTHYLRTTALSNLGSLGALSLTAWIGATPSANGMLFAVGDGTNGPRLILTAASAVSVTRGSTGGTVITDPVGFFDPFWKHVAYTFDGTTNRLYLNGIETINNATATDGTGTISRLCIFTNSNDGFLTGNSPVAGTGIADARLYGRPLSPAEIYRMSHPATRWDLYWQPPASQCFDMSLSAGTGQPWMYYAQQRAS